jgi:hypothetical protein
MMIGQSMTPNTLQNIEVYLKSGSWVLASPADFMTYIYSVDRNDYLNQFFQTASTATVRISNLIPESPYTLCAYIVNVFGVSGAINCINLYTMTWGTVIKAKLSFTAALTGQQLNNVICFFTTISATNQLYLVDQ